MLRIEKVTISPYLDEINLHIKEGEIVGLLPINNLGVEHLIEVICKGIRIHYGFVFFNGIRVNDYLSSKKNKNHVVIIDKQTTLIDTLTVYENLFVIRKGFSKHIINRKMLYQQADFLLKSFNVNIEADTLVKNLAPYEKIAIELIKAKIVHTKLVIVKDISSFLLNDDITPLHQLIKDMSSQGISFLYVCNHHQEAFLVCDRCYLMKEGRIVKNLFSNEMSDYIVEKFSYVFENRVSSKVRKELYNRPIDRNPLCEISKIYYKSLKNLSISIHSGETIVLLDSDNTIMSGLLDLLKRTNNPDSGKIIFDNKILVKGDRRIAFLDMNPIESSLFLSMSVMDNILFCDDHKLKNIWFDHRIERALEKILEKEIGDIVYQKDLYSLDTNQLYQVFQQKIIFQKPKLLVLVQPFSTLDMFQRLKNIEYLDKIKEMNISILIVTLSLSDTLQVADNLLIGRDGKIVKKYHRNEFSNLTYLHGSIPKNY